MIIQDWPKVVQRFPLQLFSAGLLLGYGLFVLWLGLRPIVLLSGLAIVALSGLRGWRVIKRHLRSPVESDHNLLHKPVFMRCIQQRVEIPSDAFLLRPSSAEGSSADAKPVSIASFWQQTQLKSDEIHALTVAIAQQDPIFIPDLLDTLYSVVDLVVQQGQSAIAMVQVRTPEYQLLAQQQSDASWNRLQETHSQLQALHDHLLVAAVRNRTLPDPSGLSDRLKGLIDENKNGILGRKTP